ncbi:ABC transporter ATP-binding protein [Burkholderia stabilis]
MTRPLLQLAGVGKHFALDGRVVPVLRDINLELQPGGFTSIVGASGCGKSTLLRLIAGLDRPDSGSILLDGAPVGAPSSDCGMIFQDHRLLPWLTVAQNVALALANASLSALARRARVEACLELVGLARFANAFPRQLSGGMAQRVAIARGLAPRPRLLLLDEPFSALDSLTRTRLQTELRHIWERENTAMILVTHDVEEAVYLASHVLVLAPNPGRIAVGHPVGLPHPRLRETSGFAALKAGILQTLERHIVQDAVA